MVLFESACASIKFAHFSAQCFEILNVSPLLRVFHQTSGHAAHTWWQMIHHCIMKETMQSKIFKHNKVRTDCRFEIGMVLHLAELWTSAVRLLDSVPEAAAIPRKNSGANKFTIAQFEKKGDASSSRIRHYLNSLIFSKGVTQWKASLKSSLIRPKVP